MEKETATFEMPGTLATYSTLERKFAHACRNKNLLQMVSQNITMLNINIPKALQNSRMKTGRGHCHLDL